MSSAARLRFATIPSASAAEGPSESNSSLVSRIRAGDDAAFEELFRGYYANLVRFALQYLQGDLDAAEDVVHDVLCRVWEHRARWTVRGSVATYLSRPTYIVVRATGAST